MALVRDAALVLRVGLGFDEWLDRLIRQVGDARPARDGRVLDLSTDIALLEVQGRSIEARSGHAHGAANPHYWLDPANAEVISARIAEALARVAPEAHDVIAAAQARFAADLKQRLERWTVALQPFQGAAVVTYHNGWPYFARRFRLNIIDVSSRKRASRRARRACQPRRAHAGEPCVRHPARTFELTEASRYLAERTGARVVVLASSVGGAPEAADYWRCSTTMSTAWQRLWPRAARAAKRRYRSCRTCSRFSSIRSGRVPFVGIHAWLGLQVLRREVVFADLALAQLSALGGTIAVAAGHAPGSLAGFGYALALTLVGAGLLTAARRVPRRWARRR